ncbi:MAG: branched-chain amino acid ABC transporter substrate-binding protein, partial [Pelagibacterales bacterium]|nr:branched-chain amino acid ABC transporter substrate-binding protein [Pelagibacterales bacterium]
MILAIVYFTQKQPTAVVGKKQEIKVGIILGFTGPIESLTPAMAASAELAFKEASDSGSLMSGSTITPIRADSTCVDSAAAQSAAEGLISQGIAA